METPVNKVTYCRGDETVKSIYCEKCAAEITDKRIL